MIELIKTSIVNGFVGSVGATTALFIFFVVKERWF
jgi:hypothetical protein